MRRLLACWLVLTLLCGFTAPLDPPIKTADITEAMRDARVEVEVHWKACPLYGANAFYQPSTREIILCRELVTEGYPTSVIRFFYAHEYGHALIGQLDVPYTGSQEVAADEFAAVMMGLYGMADEVDATGIWFMLKDHQVPYFDDHPDDDWRGYHLHCLASGAKQTYKGAKIIDEECLDYWLRTKDAVLRLLGYSTPGA